MSVRVSVRVRVRARVRVHPPPMPPGKHRTAGLRRSAPEVGSRARARAR